MKVFNLSIIAVLLMIFSLSSCSKNNMKSEINYVIRDINDKFSKVKTYQANFEFIDKTNQAESKFTGIIYYKQPGKMKTVTYLTANNTIDSIIIEDGIYKYTYIPSLRIAFKLNLKAVKNTFKLEVEKPYDYLDRNSIKFQGEQIVDEANCYVFSGKLNKLLSVENANATQEIKLWIDKKNGIINRITFYDSEQKEIMIQRFYNIKTGIKVDDNEFMLDAPKDITVIDITDQTIIAIKQLKSK